MSRRWSPIPATLFARTAFTLVITFGLFTAITVVSLVKHALIPLAERSAQDLAAFMELSVLTLVQLSPEMKEPYRSKIYQDFGLLLLEPPARPAELTDSYFPYVYRLELALGERLGAPVGIQSSLIDGARWFWVRFPVNHGRVWVGFPRDRIQTRPFVGLFVVLAVSVVLIALSAAVLARRVAAPLERLSAAAEQVAKGISPTALPETGPRELANMACQFNAMSRQVREELANRTVLLAGISHDLRTPLTRLRLASAMLQPNGQEELIQRMERDMDEMNALIAQSSELGKTLGAGQRRGVDLAELIGDLCGGRPRVVWRPSGPCRQQVDPLALRRIVGNLVENALRYSPDSVEVFLDCRHRPPVIFVLDRGPGIPKQEREAVFRPFYRLEGSRSRSTGGSGLGLAIARQLAIANEIEILLEKRHGGGTVASVHLPDGDAPGPHKPAHISG
jgi:two-component system osmolarity sensor histidine kinase EnvZ